MLEGIVKRNGDGPLGLYQRQKLDRSVKLYLNEEKRGEEEGKGGGSLASV